ncbi:lipolytic protein G-D-S-L family [Thalassoporum mexicanum PCC 7367]|uniref:G-D-S-L family lipolytic protein n=1 Tax=Thalassoporum mexicanum TaxID=3457544 RepID=UPI00029FB15C|nr:G-D-S-L family lipolytic protein [Pseudanabaena sp. PCC 7367]AFY68462.1 lipolytic protein G-D-S-L family [Pseudanabaena sp. PCC 7367]
MRRRNSYSFGSYRSKPRAWLRNILLFILIGIPLLLVVAEFATRGIVNMTGMAEQLGAVQDINIAQAYELKLEDEDGNPYPGLEESYRSGQLRVRFSPIMGYQLVPDQSNDYWQINPQGFRDRQPISIEKPANETRIFVLGNSTAFGQMAESNNELWANRIEELMARRLQEQANAPEKFKPLEMPYFADEVAKMEALPPRIKEGTYRVITAAVPGYTSGNELSLLVHQVMAYAPDCVVVVDGYEDLRLPSDRVARELGNVEELLQDPSAHNNLHLSRRFDNFLNSYYLVKVYRHWFGQKTSAAKPFQASQLAADADELNARLDRYRYNLKQIARITRDISTVVIVQPEITGKENALTPPESQVLEALGSEYRDRAKTSFDWIYAGEFSKELPNTRMTSFYDLYSDFNEQAFYDPIHLTPAAQEVIARRIYDILADIFAIAPTPRATRR